MRYVLTLLAFVLLPTRVCGQVRDTVLVEPDSTYRAWWAEIETCAERAKPMQETLIYHVRATRRGFEMARSRQTYDQTRAAAFTDGDWLILIATPFARNKARVQHEFLHAIASPGWHDPKVFQRGPCARLVPCDGECRQDTRPPTTTATLTP